MKMGKKVFRAAAEVLYKIYDRIWVVRKMLGIRAGRNEMYKTMRKEE